MKPWLEAAYLTSKSLVMLLVIPAAAAVWIGAVGVLVGTGRQRLYGLAAVAIGAALYAVIVWWFGSLSRAGLETTHHASERVTMDDWDRIYYRKR